MKHYQILYIDELEITISKVEKWISSYIDKDDYKKGKFNDHFDLHTYCVECEESESKKETIQRVSKDLASIIIDQKINIIIGTREFYLQIDSKKEKYYKVLIDESQEKNGEKEGFGRFSLDELFDKNVEGSLAKLVDFNSVKIKHLVVRTYNPKLFKNEVIEIENKLDHILGQQAKTFVMETSHSFVRASSEDELYFTERKENDKHYYYHINELALNEFDKNFYFFLGMYLKQEVLIDNEYTYDEITYKTEARIIDELKVLECKYAKYESIEKENAFRIGHAAFISDILNKGHDKHLFDVPRKHYYDRINKRLEFFNEWVQKFKNEDGVNKGKYVDSAYVYYHYTLVNNQYFLIHDFYSNSQAKMPQQQEEFELSESKKKEFLQFLPPMHASIFHWSDPNDFEKYKFIEDERWNGFLQGDDMIEICPDQDDKTKLEPIHMFFFYGKSKPFEKEDSLGRSKELLNYTLWKQGNLNEFLDKDKKHKKAFELLEYYADAIENISLAATQALIAENNRRSKIRSEERAVIAKKYKIKVLDYKHIINNNMNQLANHINVVNSYYDLDKVIFMEYLSKTQKAIRINSACLDSIFDQNQKLLKYLKQNTKISNLINFLFEQHHYLSTPAVNGIELIENSVLDFEIKKNLINDAFLVLWNLWYNAASNAIDKKMDVSIFLKNGKIYLEFKNNLSNVNSDIDEAEYAIDYLHLKNDGSEIVGMGLKSVIKYLINLNWVIDYENTKIEQKDTQNVFFVTLALT